MGGSTKTNTPPPPDPYVTAQAQSAINLQAARDTAALNRISQFSPQGSLTYERTGAPNYNEWYADQFEKFKQGGYSIYDAYGRNDGGQSQIDKFALQKKTEFDELYPVSAITRYSPEQQALYNQQIEL
jgi:hypothetical protein